jgi:hypothetical protein
MSAAQPDDTRQALEIREALDEIKLHGLRFKRPKPAPVAPTSPHPTSLPTLWQSIAASNARGVLGLAGRRNGGNLLFPSSTEGHSRRAI